MESRSEGIVFARKAGLGKTLCWKGQQKEGSAQHHLSLLEDPPAAGLLPFQITFGCKLLLQLSNSFPRDKRNTKMYILNIIYIRVLETVNVKEKNPYLRTKG